MMRYLLLIMILGLILLPAVAQEEGLTPYEIALYRIEQAQSSGQSWLNLSNLGLSEVPPEIGSLSKIQTIHLGTNQLTTLPPEIGQLTSLTELDVSHNQLSSLPPELGQLSNLARLDAWDNQLTGLPAEMGNLHSLQWLNLTHNQLKTLPLELMELNVQWMGLHDNPFSAIPPEVMAGHREAITNYLRNEAWWHLQRLIVSAVGSVGLVASLILGIRWRNRFPYEKKKKG
jgi:hypothetical protein